MLIYKQKRHRKVSLKRRLQWLGAWSVVILAVLLAGGIVIAAVSGVVSMCNRVLAGQENGVDTNSAKLNVNGNEDMDLQEGDMEATALADTEAASTVENAEWEMEQQDAPDDTLKEIDVSSLLVNKSSYLPTDYRVSLTTLKNGQQVASVIYEDLRDMLFTGEEEAEVSFLVASGYRSSEQQQQLLDDEIIKNQNAGMSEEDARTDALLTVAPAHFSEHETGLAVDIVAVSNQRLDDSQESTPENQWLRENCYKYGFILRYPEGKEDITGFSYESWHFRYVGKEAAKLITEQGITLEEYLSGIEE